MYSTIVVPLDGSALSERAVPTALVLARRGSATLLLIHVRESAVRPAGAPLLDSRFDDEAERHAQARVSSMADTIARESGLAAQAVFLDGEIAPTVQAYAAARGTDLVVMTTHGRGGISRLWLGSVADELVRRSTAPILLIRPDVEGAPDVSEPLFHRILVPLDGSPRAEEVLTHAAALGTPGHTEYVLLRVLAPRTSADLFPSVATMLAPDELARRLAGAHARADAYLAGVAASFREIGAQVTTHTALRAQAAREILEFAREQDVDLIVLSTRVRSTTERLLIGSVADKVLRGTAGPVLVCGPRIEVAASSHLEGASAAATAPSSTNPPGSPP